MTELFQSSDKTALVVGLGISGRSVCELLNRQGIRVIATDRRSRDALGDELKRLEDSGCELHLGEHRLADFLAADQIILSPGVPLDLEPLARAREVGVEIVGELEWAWRQVDVPTVAVSGTNGKTTTTTIIGELLKAAGRRVFVGGNIGTPLSRWLLEQGEPREADPDEAIDVEVLVLEVSSFQLDTAQTFAPHVGVLLNVTEDHLDRYPHFSDYLASKASLFARQQPSDYAVLNVDDPHCRKMINSLKSRVLTYSTQGREARAVIRDRTIRMTPIDGTEIELDLENCPLTGVHNEENLLAALLTASALGIDPTEMTEALSRLRPLPHRIEPVGSWHGIDFYNDSKGTNVGAVIKALESFNAPVVLLMGGREKGGSYEPLGDLLRRRVKSVLTFGESGPRLAKELAAWTDTHCLTAMDQAFCRAVEVASAGDVVLLSPACSSFDQYASYAERGDHFKRLVTQLMETSELARKSPDRIPQGARKG